jgi:hypothetical protein
VNPDGRRGAEPSCEHRQKWCYDMMLCTIIIYIYYTTQDHDINNFMLRTYIMFCLLLNSQFCQLLRASHFLLVKHIFCCLCLMKQKVAHVPVTSHWLLATRPMPWFVHLTVAAGPS